MATSTGHLRENLVVFDLFSGGQHDLRHLIRDVTDRLDRPELLGPLYTVTHELAINALKAVYKKVFFEKFIVEIGLEEIDYRKWLLLFKSEIEAHNADNFARVVRETDQGVRIAVRLNDHRLKIEVVNPGRPSRVELERIQQALDLSRSLDMFSNLLEDLSEEDHREGASLGIPLIAMTLRKIGARDGALRIRGRGLYTFSGFTIAREVLEKYAPL